MQRVPAVEDRLIIGQTFDRQARAEQTERQPTLGHDEQEQNEHPAGRPAEPHVGGNFHGFAALQASGGLYRRACRSGKAAFGRTGLKGTSGRAVQSDRRPTETARETRTEVLLDVRVRAQGRQFGGPRAHDLQTESVKS